MIETPRLTDTADRPMAYIHLTIPSERIREEMGPGISEVYAALADQGLKPAGPWFTHHLHAPDDEFDFEICVPTDGPVSPTGRVKAGLLPARGRVARTVYHGGYEGLGEAWGEFMDWIEAEGLKPAPDLWEVYAVGPESSDDPADWRTELNRPLLG